MSQTIKSNSGSGTQTLQYFELPRWYQFLVKVVNRSLLLGLHHACSWLCCWNVELMLFGDLLSKVRGYRLCPLLWPYLFFLLNIRNVTPDICSTTSSAKQLSYTTAVVERAWITTARKCWLELVKFVHHQMIIVATLCWLLLGARHGVLYLLIFTRTFWGSY